MQAVAVYELIPMALRSILISDSRRTPISKNDFVVLHESRIGELVRFADGVMGIAVLASGPVLAMWIWLRLAAFHGNLDWYAQVVLNALGVATILESVGRVCLRLSFDSRGLARAPKNLPPVLQFPHLLFNYQPLLLRTWQGVTAFSITSVAIAISSFSWTVVFHSLVFTMLEDSAHRTVAMSAWAVFLLWNVLHACAAAASIDTILVHEDLKVEECRGLSWQEKAVAVEICIRVSWVICVVTPLSVSLLVYAQV